MNRGAGCPILARYSHSRICRMIRRYFRTLFAGCLLLAPAFAFAKSRTMSPQQYEAFINKLDAAVSGWQDQIKHLDAINLPIDGEKRKQLTAEDALAGAVLNQIKSTVSAERDHPSLALEITMLDRLSSASGVLTELITDVPDSAARKPWADAVRAIEDDISAYELPLHEHVLSKAYDLEYQVEDCAAATKNRKQ